MLANLWHTKILGLLWCGLSLGIVGTGCSSDSDDTKPQEAVAAAPATTNAASKAAPIHCYKWPFEQLPPLYVKESGIMVTRVMDSCVTLDGEHGFTREASWMAMGFPCTRGPGKVEWRGHYYKPKMLSFVVSNSCPMAPHDLAQVKPLGVSNLGLNPEARLLAYYPFSVQFWELVDYNEADTGHVIEVRSQGAVLKAWRDFRGGTPLRVNLYGRENTWVKGREMFKVDAELVKNGQNTFVLNILSAHPLKPSELTQAKAHCEALRPPRNCGQIFAL